MRSEALALHPNSLRPLIKSFGLKSIIVLNEATAGLQVALRLGIFIEATLPLSWSRAWFLVAPHFLRGCLYFNLETNAHNTFPVILGKFTVSLQEFFIHFLVTSANSDLLCYLLKIFPPCLIWIGSVDAGRVCLGWKGMLLKISVHFVRLWGLWRKHLLGWISDVQVVSFWIYFERVCLGWQL